jgi:hypothetical protein
VAVRSALTVRFPGRCYRLAIRTPGVSSSPSTRSGRATFFRDLFRGAEYLGVPMAPPEGPIRSCRRWSDGKFRTGAQQPYIYRLTRLGVLAEERGTGSTSRTRSGA